MQSTEFKRLFDHIKYCNTASLQKDFLPFRAHKQIVGWVKPSFLMQLQSYGVIIETDGIYSVPASLSLQELGDQLIENKVVQSMQELFDVYPSPYAKPIGQIDRSIIPNLGFIGTGVHLNGLVKDKEDIYLWVAKRSANKRLDPGKLDHIVAGGIPSGLQHHQALIKEANEEASIPLNIIKKAEYKTMITYSMLRPEGLRRDVLYCYDLWLPKTFKPIPNDGEVESFQLMNLKEVYQRVCNTNDFKFNVNLVLIDLFFRMGIISNRTANAHLLKTGLRGKLFP